MRALSIFLLALTLIAAGPAGADTRPGRVTGGKAYALAPWFKASFLDFRADVEEAREQGRQVMVFLHLDECPYCARMLAEDFHSGANREFMQKHFDVIAVNVQGSLSLTWTDGAAYTERTLARHLKTIATPTIVLLGEDGTNVLQLTGYRDPAAFRHALEFVQSRSYRKQSFAAYLASRKKAMVYTLRDHAQFSSVKSFKDYTKPLALLFEDGSCAECARFHDTTLNRPDVVEEMKKFLFVRFDAESDTPIVGLDGTRTTPALWVKSLNLSYRPGLVLFDQGREIYRIDGRLYHFHFKEALRYVGGAYYRQYPSLSAYRAAYRAELMRQGIDINCAE